MQVLTVHSGCICFLVFLQGDKNHIACVGGCIAFFNSFLYFLLFVTVSKVKEVCLQSKNIIPDLCSDNALQYVTQFIILFIFLSFLLTAICFITG